MSRTESQCRGSSRLGIYNPSKIDLCNPHPRFYSSFQCRVWRHERGLGGRSSESFPNLRHATHFITARSITTLRHLRRRSAPTAHLRPLAKRTSPAYKFLVRASVSKNTSHSAMAFYTTSLNSHNVCQLCSWESPTARLQPLPRTCRPAAADALLRKSSGRRRQLCLSATSLAQPSAALPPYQVCALWMANSIQCASPQCTNAYQS